MGRGVVGVVVGLALTATAGVVHSADDRAQASGHWQGGGIEFDITGAYAYPSPVGSDHGAGIRVAISNAGSFYPQNAKLVRGSVDGDWAQVLVTGETSSGDPAHGEAIMQLVDGTWRVWLDQADGGGWPDHLAP